jgi:gas vesicle protein
MATKASKLLLAGLAGIAAGAALGILFAPAKGSKTRKRLKEGIRELSELEGNDFSEKLKSFASSFSSEEEEEEDKQSAPEAEQ